MSPKLCLGAIINGLYPSYPTQSTVIIHWLCYCTAVSMLSFLPVIVCGLLELKRICVGSLLIVWDGNESVQEFYYLLGVDANLCMIFIDCLEWKWISAWSSLLAWSVNESVQVIYCLFMSVSALGIQLFCLIPAYYVLVTSSVLDFQHHMLWSSMIWFEVSLLFLLLIFVVLLTITLYNFFSKLSGRNIG